MFFFVVVFFMFSCYVNVVHVYISIVSIKSVN